MMDDSGAPGRSFFLNRALFISRVAVLHSPPTVARVVRRGGGRGEVRLFLSFRVLEGFEWASR
jgi:hypothetical protein